MTIYIWIDDFVENLEEIKEQISCEFKDLKVKIILVYEESFVWEMGDKSL